MNELLSLLRLVAPNLRRVSVEQEEDLDDEFDMTEWTMELFRMCPHLEGLDLPWTAQIKRFGDIVEAAEAGSCGLRSLAVRHSSCSDSTDLIDLMDVLCDAEHPLTRRLEELIVAVDVPASPTRDFGTAWQRLLEHNRTLHTITLYHYGTKHVDMENRPVAVRSGPLDIHSKAAFLSIVNDTKTSPSARTRFDTSVLAIIFAFAAPHRVRAVEIEFQMPEDEMETELSDHQ